MRSYKCACACACERGRQTLSVWEREHARMWLPLPYIGSAGADGGGGFHIIHYRCPLQRAAVATAPSEGGPNCDGDCDCDSFFMVCSVSECVCVCVCWHLFCDCHRRAPTQGTKGVPTLGILFFWECCLSVGAFFFFGRWSGCFLCVCV